MSVLIATGVYAARDMAVPGAGSQGVLVYLNDGSGDPFDSLASFVVAGTGTNDYQSTDAAGGHCLGEARQREGDLQRVEGKGPPRRRPRARGRRLRLLEALQDNGRLSNVELAERIGVSRPSLREALIALDSTRQPPGSTTMSSSMRTPPHPGR